MHACSFDFQLFVIKNDGYSSQAPSTSTTLQEAEAWLRLASGALAHTGTTAAAQGLQRVRPHLAERCGTPLKGP